MRVRGFPEKYVRFAERFLEEVKQVDPTVRIRKHKVSTVDIRENFVRIEALLKRKQGIRVSFYGTPDQFDNPPEILGVGMGSYSRAVVETESDLQSVIPLIQQARNLKSARR